MDRGSMDQGSMDQGSMDQGSMDQGSMDHGSMDHGSMDHGSMDHGSMDHGSMDHGSMGHGDHVAMFRDRFWISVALTVPVLLFSEMIQDWFGFRMPAFTGDHLVAPLFGTAMCAYGGLRFLQGGIGEAARGVPA